MVTCTPPGDTLTPLCLPLQWLSLLLLLLGAGPPPTLGMLDTAFPHPGASTPPQPCPLRCSCPRMDMVDCGGLGLRVFPDSISKTVQHLALQVGHRAGCWELLWAGVLEVGLGTGRTGVLGAGLWFWGLTGLGAGCWQGWGAGGLGGGFAGTEAGRIW